MEEFTEKIKSIASLITQENKAKIFEDTMNVVVDFLSKYFNVNPEEVGILFITSNGKFLRFVAPKKLFKNGATFPISKRESISTKVITTLKPDIQNNFSNIKHLSIYEKVKISEEKPKAIQKMLTYPLIIKNKAVGVIQISRKGDTLEQSGYDFTQADIEKLTDLSALFLPYLTESKPDFI